MEDNLNLRDQLHDLHTGQRSLGTKDEIISGIWELREYLNTPVAAWRFLSTKLTYRLVISTTSVARVIQQFRE